MLLAELIVLALSLWQLFDITGASDAERTSAAGGWSIATSDCYLQESCTIEQHRIPGIV
jgi:hypothetical protein